jgi:hypothetical protein
MVDRKHDTFTATGAHRAWIGERPADAALLDAARGTARDPRAWSGGAAANGNARHAAITRGLSNFPSYKTWAEKARSNWRKDKAE